ncbi:MAG: clan AA aspartic protease [bacterium]|nr:clan AA aspartic protease [bacterium]
MMGEVKIRISLTNAIDEGMARRGTLRVEEVRTEEIEAIVDTGAITCVLPRSVVDRLGVVSAFRQVAVYADGRREEVDVSEPVLIEIQGRKVYEECMILGEEVLVGQTALEKTDLQVDCRSRTLRPNPKHPDRPVMPVRISSTSQSSTAHA